MIKIVVLASTCLLCFNLQAQQQITIDFWPSFDAPASIEIQTKQHQVFQLVFRQLGNRKPEESAFSWMRDTTSIVPVRRLGQYFRQFTFSDTISLETEQSASLLKAFTEMYVNSDKLSKLKDHRIMLDGMFCLITIPDSQHKPYKIGYRPPVSTQTQPMDRLIRQVLAALKMRSTNPATVNYCMVIDGYLQ